MFNLLCKTFYSLLLLYIRFDFKHKYTSVVHGGELSDDEREEIYLFRNSCYESKSQYLVPNNSLKEKTERNFDIHSFHSRVYDKKNQLVAVVRLLPYPFEMSTFSLPVGVKMSQFSNYLEISRLVTSKPGQGIGKRLLMLVGIWAIKDTIYDGFLAVCRKTNLKLFSLFGLSKIANFIIEQRSGAEYSLIRADFRLITKATLKLFSQKVNPVYQLALAVKTFSRKRSLF
jgi:hypothetical protein